MTASFVYDGDGARVQSTINTVVTTFVGNHYEVTDGTVTKYYFAGSSRIAMRTNGTLNYLLSDHLGSTSITTEASGNKMAEMRYKAWGETRYTERCRKAVTCPPLGAGLRPRRLFDRRSEPCCPLIGVGLGEAP